MSVQILLCVAVATVASVQVAVAQDRPSSLWNHNGSVVGLYADGASRVFRYERPRAGMQAEGVTKGTLLFEGTKLGETYEGTAYVFSRQCGATPYSVSGPVSADSRQVTLTGSAASGFDGNCQPTSYRQDVLQFDYVQSVGAPPAVASYRRTDEEERQTRERRDQAAKEIQAEEERLRWLRDLREGEERKLRETRVEQERLGRVRRERKQREERDVRAKLAREQQHLEVQNYRQTEPEFVELLRRAETRTIRLQLQAATTYAIVAACDTDCTHVAVSLRDEQGRLLLESPEKLPAVIIAGAPETTGTFSAEVTVPGCRQSDCYAGILLLHQAPKTSSQ